MGELNMLKDYRKATFPLEIRWNDYGNVRLLAGFENGVVGVTYYRSEDGVETYSQAITWNGDGVYADGQYPEMNLPPPPAKIHEVILAMEDEIHAIRERLDANPDAPEAWRKPDEQRISSIERKIAKMKGG